MRNKGWKKALAMCFACVLLCGLFCSCAKSNEGDEPSPQEQNRTYMSQVNQITEDLRSCFADFIDAVSRNDMVAIKTHAENAYKKIDELKAIEAPATLEDVHKAYCDGADSLKSALQDGINLLSDVMDRQNAGERIDLSAYKEQLLKIQEQYDAGMKSFGEGDQLASDKE